MRLLVRLVCTVLSGASPKGARFSQPPSTKKPRTTHRWKNQYERGVAAGFVKNPCHHVLDLPFRRGHLRPTPSSPPGMVGGALPSDPWIRRDPLRRGLGSQSRPAAHMYVKGSLGRKSPSHPPLWHQFGKGPAHRIITCRPQQPGHGGTGKHRLSTVVGAKRRPSAESLFDEKTAMGSQSCRPLIVDGGSLGHRSARQNAPKAPAQGDLFAHLFSAGSLRRRTERRTSKDGPRLEPRALMLRRRCEGFECASLSV